MTASCKERNRFKVEIVQTSAAPFVVALLVFRRRDAFLEISFRSGGGGWRLAVEEGAEGEEEVAALT